jgi:ferrochelatase
MTANAKRIAIVLFNLGGPDGPDSVRPFLRNLFRDPAIIGAPGPIREALAWLISTLRDKSARENYAKMGGGSPLLPESQAQADALTARLAERGVEAKAFIAMRYWHPFTEEAVAEVKAWGADEVVLLPLYPHFSTSTTGSSLTAWKEAGGGKARTVCCYPLDGDFIAAHAERIRESWEAAGKPDDARVLLSAHGLPEQTVAKGDPYQWQIEQTAAAVMKHLPELPDWRVCYQSRVGPLKWIGPSTEEEIEAGGRDQKHLVLTPIAFVSEHIETLVELDEEYGELAGEHGVPGYSRAPALGVSELYINSLAGLVEDALQGETGLKPPNGVRICPGKFGCCPNPLKAAASEEAA